jgi:tetratricopeptide (TPR) repeat protein
MEVHMRGSTALVVVAALSLSGLAAASGTRGLPQNTAPPLTPEQEAVEYFNDGVSHRDKADKLEKEALAEKDPAKQAKLLEKSKSQHEASIKKYQKAVAKDPKLFQAWGSLGYAYRKTGNYPTALEAYDKALALQSNYTPAIEYRAEAYLGLNRLGEVKAAYMMLFNADRARADELAAAMQKWVERRRSDAAGVDPATLDEFTKWVAERKQLSSQTSALTDPNAPRW